MKRLLLLVAALLLSSCSTQRNTVEERRRYWETVVNSEIPIGSSYGDVKRWADSRRLSLLDEPSAGKLIAGLEYVPVNDHVCIGFGLSLQLTLNTERNVTQEKINSFGNCL
jgi:hypothetical protein